METIGSGIRDGKKSDPGSGINIPDPQRDVAIQFRKNVIVVRKKNPLMHNTLKLCRTV
jgi:hypothetical protein